MFLPYRLQNCWLDGSPFFYMEPDCEYRGFAIITWKNPKILEKPCITKGLATCQFLGLIFSCNKVIMVDPEYPMRYPILKDWLARCLAGVVRWSIDASISCDHCAAVFTSGHNKAKLHSGNLTWLAGKWTLWRCISHHKWGYSTAMLVYQRVVGGWTNPSEKYAQVKLDHFPKYK